jgi:hypothetical protein
MATPVDLGELRRRVEREIDTYVYEVPAGAIGNPWPQSKVEAGLQAFRDALVDPYCSCRSIDPDQDG